MLGQASHRDDLIEYPGHCHAVIAAGGTIEDKHVLLVGAGGAGSALACEFLNMGCRSPAIHDLGNARRDQLIARRDQKFPGHVHGGSTDARGFDLVSNAPPPSTCLTGTISRWIRSLCLPNSLWPSLCKRLASGGLLRQKYCNATWPDASAPCSGQGVSTGPARRRVLTCEIPRST